MEAEAVSNQMNILIDRGERRRHRFGGHGIDTEEHLVFIHWIFVVGDTAICKKYKAL